MADPQPSLGHQLIGQGVNWLGQMGLGYLANRPIAKQNAWQRAMVEQQIARRNALQGLALPSMIRALGYRDPQQIQAMTGQVNAASGMPATPIATTPPATGTGTLGKIGAGAGVAGLGLGLAGKAIGGFGGAALGGLGATLGPVGAGVALGAMGLNKIGQGRRTANIGTGEGGFERAFDQAMAQAVRLRDAGNIEGARQALQQGHATFMAGINEFRNRGGNYQKVAEQAMNANPAKWQTYQSIAQSLGMPGA